MSHPSQPNNPESEPSFRAYGLTDKGMRRDNNDDSFFVDSDKRVFAVADGIGGLPDGAVASKLSMETLDAFLQKERPQSPLDFVSLVHHINNTVYQTSQADNKNEGMGTTLTIAQLDGKTIHLGHVGDSCAVLFKKDCWVKLTKDHTMTDELVALLKPGEMAYFPTHFNHTLTRCIGFRDEVKVDTYTSEMESGDRLLLFSDGILETFELDEVHQYIYDCDDPEPFVHALIATSNERGSPDNVTAVAVFRD